MTPTQRAAAKRLAKELASVHPLHPYAQMCGSAAAILRELLAEPVINQQMTTELAEPVQEPVIWIQSNHLQHAKNGPYLARTGPTKLMSDFIPLYAAPQQRKPLSADQIRDAVNDHAFWATSKNFIFRIARAIERAHGITGEPQ